MGTRITLTVITLVSLVLAGCAAPDDGETTPTTPTTTTGTPTTPTQETTSDPTEAYPTLAFTATESGEGMDKTYGFDGPTEATAGWNTVTLSSQVFEPHQVLFLKLEDGHTYEELVQALEEGAQDPANYTGYPDWVTRYGGVGGATFGQTGTVFMELEEGDYVLVCQIPDARGAHMFHGMHAPLTVGPSEEEHDPPAADFTFVMDEYSYEIDGDITPGRHVFAVRNDGTQPHEAPLVKLEGEATMNDFIASLENPQGPPPGALVGGIVDINPGETIYSVHTFEAGNYGTVCFVPDAGDRRPHLAHGMVIDFTVEAA